MQIGDSAYIFRAETGKRLKRTENTDVGTSAECKFICVASNENFQVKITA